MRALARGRVDLILSGFAIGIISVFYHVYVSRYWDNGKEKRLRDAFELSGAFKSKKRIIPNN